MMTMDEIAKEAHATALEKGWWEDGIEKRSMSEQLANFHAEVSEAWECYRSGQMETSYGKDGKPEGFWVEIADVLIRLGDSLGAYGKDAEKSFVYCNFDMTIPEFIGELHTTTAQLWKFGISLQRGAANIYGLCRLVAEMRGELQKLDDALIVKLEYNKTRPYRHGNKKA
jgi:hypothetical protein